MRGYLSDKLLPSDSEAHKYIMRSTAPEICAEGPARTSKTITNLEKWAGLHAKYKGLRSCIVRTNSVDLTDTVRFDLTNTIFRYQLDDPRSQIRQQGGLTQFHHLYLNEGECRVGGMNRPGAILGGEYDLVLLCELSQFTFQQYMLLKTRCAGSAANWVLEDGTVISQMLSDTNPDEDDVHWMYEREAEGLLEFVKFDFEDNPFFFRENRWSRVGKTVVNELDRGLTGIYHDRYFKGLRVGQAGRVFQLQPHHFIDELPDLSEYLIYNAMDFGIASPNTGLWIAENSSANDVIVAWEYRKTDETIIDMGNQVNAYNEDFGYNVAGTVIDNDEHRQKLLQDHCDIYAHMARKGAGSVMDGIILIQQALKEGRLRFYTGGRLNRDPELARKGEPLSVIDEMKLYHFKPEEKRTGANNDENPVKKNDHGIDALRYWFLWKQAYNHVPFFGEVLKTNKRPPALI